MGFNFPGPLKGWRVFAGEVGVIVLGVLLALGAQQLAEALQRQSEVREFRRTIDHEIGLNLFVYDVRSRGSACNMRRIRDLLAWLRTADDRESLPDLDIYGPAALFPYRAAWDSRDGNVFASVPPDARLKYAEFYDELGGNNARLEAEIAAWSAMKGFELAGPISHQERRELYRHLAEAFVADGTLAANLPVSKKIAEELGVTAIRPDNLTKEFLASIDACAPIILPEKTPNSTGGSVAN
ncbi:hypothetical protein GRI89_04890 [Altererythrobacter salegens]|uniref:Uncharacterized protein n=1 Tax=Croceibacterium salegens TaxID=1737568 RepID=A0A6I4SVT4_9SPHN|nr:hypothetical protein [Croceibacterium salegens]MXO58876.1 hypothetical protein [Croceibacterium salegens]